MKESVIGIIGGMSSYATLDFFSRLLEAFPAKKEWDRPRIIIDNNCTMPSRVRAILYNENRENLINNLSDSINNLINSGATKIVLACNTSHYFLNDIYLANPKAKDYILDIIEECYKDCLKNKINQATLLATEGTLDTKIYNRYFRNIKVNYPKKKCFDGIRYFIEIVKQNNIDKSSLDDFYNFVESFSDKNIILGCTELPVLYRRCLNEGYLFSKNIIDPLDSVINTLKNI